MPGRELVITALQTGLEGEYMPTPSLASFSLIKVQSWKSRVLACATILIITNQLLIRFRRSDRYLEHHSDTAATENYKSVRVSLEPCLTFARGVLLLPALAEALQDWWKWGSRLCTTLSLTAESLSLLSNILYLQLPQNNE